MSLQWVSRRFWWNRSSRSIQKINDEGVTILLVEQNAQMALSIADRGYVLETGTVALSGDADELMENPEVQAAYLGG